jgi:hypothetical protein
MLQGAVIHRSVRAVLLSACCWIGLTPVPANAEATTTHLALTGLASRPYGDRPIVQGWVAVPDLPCPASPPDFPGGIVSIRLDGEHWYTSQLVFSSACVEGQSQATFDVDKELFPIGTHVVTAEHSGDGRYLPSASAPLTVTVTPQFSGSASPESAVVQVGVTNGIVTPNERWDCRLSVAQMSASPNVAPPAGLVFPYGVFNYGIDTCVHSSVPTPTPLSALRQRMLLKAPQALAAGASLLMYGPVQPGSFPQWYQLPARIKGSLAEAFLEDGGMGDQTGAGDGLISGFVAIAVPKALGLKLDVQGLWWAGANENGWGMSIGRSGDTLFNTFFVYDDNGRPQWIVMPGGTWDASFTSYTGSLYIPTGTWFGNYDASRLDVGAPVGAATITFSGSDAASLTYSVRGASGTKSLQKQIFATSGTIAGNFAGLWWGGAPQNGWGLSIHQQGGTLFNVWYTYDATGTAVWYVMPGGSWIAPRVYSGPLYRTRGSPWAGRVYDPARYTVELAGTMTLALDNESNGYLTYVIDGVDQTRSITRQPF